MNDELLVIYYELFLMIGIIFAFLTIVLNFLRKMFLRHLKF